MQYFWRRRELSARPLLRDHGIASVILENPFCALRRRRDPSHPLQMGSASPSTRCVHAVSASRLTYGSGCHTGRVADLFTIGAALVAECIVLFRWSVRGAVRLR